MMMMIAMRSTPSGIVTFKDLCFSKREKSDLQTLFFFYSPQPQKQSQKQRRRSTRSLREERVKESVNCDK
jgi:hypothetical protein|tara:strand:+ start:3414 stop:3623 length:210 start_codon:yes stop_codon:yes gene_type:complete